MANATDRVKKRVVRIQDRFIRRSSETLGAATRYYQHALVGTDVTGYLCKGDDSQSWVFAGVVRGNEGNPLLPAGTAGTPELDLDIEMPYRLEVSIAGVAVTDLGKKVYALDDQTGTLSAAATTFGNFIGHVVEIVAPGIALVELCYDGVAAHARYGVTRVLAATGAQSLTRCDLNKVIIVPNTAAYTITLPAVADTQAGDRLTFVKTTADAAAATLDGNAAETIDNGATLATIDARYDCAELVSTGTEWVVLNRDIA
ncbi:hypothetical protein GobsT_37640 [Gemmata obscuriglobus]|uniref:hypothetical protein n=1 Tax=Gemmata obscuriglobus TaxID=114 RepID=UPI00016C49E7|nr:hypothetical protein [Gemmata obscuriglobus]QEG28975.1 hypothetical protein GobsT_37640 [Gemmata obscuriglobus]VTS07525.1 Putative uncharacterized protein OS=Methylobacter tundripaludum SV96 GN=Mettu_0955 PE=4 SV=1 [Gemmata obscuriglobus UQM 2246]